MRKARPAYTLLEVMLALAIAVLLLAAVYSAIGYQMRQAQAGRDLIDQTTIARSILNKMGSDVSGAISLGDAARFRRKNSGGSSSGAASGASTATAGTSTSGTPSTGTATNTSSSTGSGGTTSSADPSMSGAGTSEGTTSVNAPVQLPLGVIGSSTELHLFVSRVPGEIYGPKPGDPGQLTSDLRRITYWLASEGGGLCRMEVRLITSDQATAPEVPTTDVEQYRMAPEVGALEFSYFDGTSWVESWDSTAPGPDEITPMGSPRAIAIKIGVVPSGKTIDGQEPQMKTYRHVVFVPTAGGIPMQPTEAEMPSTMSSATSGTTQGGATAP